MDFKQAQIHIIQYEKVESKSGIYLNGTQRSSAVFEQVMSNLILDTCICLQHRKCA